MLLRNRKDESDGSKSFEASPLITAVRNIFKQAKIEMDGVCANSSYCSKMCLFLNEGTLTLASSEQKVPVIFK